jgi:outer membrane receptor for ferric coprogen and ferric-rhodotorulic acid
MEDEDLRPDHVLGPLTGRGRDYGLKFDLFSGKVNATITRFNVSQDGARDGGIDGNVYNYINAIWTTIENGGPNTVVTDADNPDGHHFGGVDSRSQASEGYEFEITANPIPNWRVSFNISKTDNTISNVGGALEAYMNKHRSEWESNASLGYDASRSPGNLTNAGGSNTVGALIAGLDTILGYAQSEEGQIEVNNRPWNANAYTAYTFSQGSLKGLTVGGGLNYRGDSILGVKPADSPDDRSQMFKGGAYYLYNAMVAYEFKLRSKYSIRVQLNVDNLFDDRDKQVLASAWNPNAGALETQYYYFRPRSYKLSATLKF